jgi:hypothetical protein
MSAWLPYRRARAQSAPVPRSEWRKGKAYRIDPSDKRALKESQNFCAVVKSARGGGSKPEVGGGDFACARRIRGPCRLTSIQVGIAFLRIVNAIVEAI